MHNFFSYQRFARTLTVFCITTAAFAGTSAPPANANTKPDAALSAAMAAAAQPLTAQEAAQKLVQRHGNYAITLQLEKDFYQALTQRDQAWLDAHAALFRKQDEQLLKAKGELSMQEAMEMGQKMGACHQASTMLYGAIAVAQQKGFAEKGKPVDGHLPANIVREFAKQMTLCESQGRHPPSRRLIGATQP